MKVSELEGAELDFYVAKAENITLEKYDGRLYARNQYCANSWSLSEYYSRAEQWHPSTDWSQGGPIIERERLQVLGGPDGWCSQSTMPNKLTGWILAETPLIAAMRAYVASKFGDEV